MTIVALFKEQPQSLHMWWTKMPNDDRLKMVTGVRNDQLIALKRGDVVETPAPEVWRMRVIYENTRV